MYYSIKYHTYRLLNYPTDSVLIKLPSVIAVKIKKLYKSVKFIIVFKRDSLQQYIIQHISSNVSVIVLKIAL